MILPSRGEYKPPSIFAKDVPRKEVRALAEQIAQRNNKELLDRLIERGCDYYSSSRTGIYVKLGGNNDGSNG